MAIDGDGFFVVQGSEQRFTRDGSFTLNSANQLVTSDGSFVQGFGVDADSNIIPGKLQNITVPLGSTTPARPTTDVTLEGNLNSSGPVATGASILTSQLLTTVGGAGAPTTATALTQLADTTSNTTPLFTVGQQFTLKGSKGGRETPERTFTVAAGSTVQDLLTFYQQGLGIDTTVPDDGNPLTPTAGGVIEPDTADPTSARLVVTGNLGKDNALQMPASAFTDATGAAPLTFADGTNAAGLTSNPTGESIHTAYVGYDSLGTPVAVDVTAVLESKSDTGNTWRFYATSGDTSNPDTVVGNGTLDVRQQRQAEGEHRHDDHRGPRQHRRQDAAVDEAELRRRDLRDEQQLDAGDDPAGRLADRHADQLRGRDGRQGAGHLQQRPDAHARPARGRDVLEQRGPDRPRRQPVRRRRQQRRPDRVGAAAARRGAVRAGSLEQSNVDLSKEFVNLIISSTGFSAASRVITTSDQLITDLLNSCAGMTFDARPANVRRPTAGF